MQVGSLPPRLCASLRFAACLLLVPAALSARAQLGSAPTNGSPDGSPVNVSGSVIDALTGQPVGHALVKLGARAVLTDSEGYFSFQQVDQNLTSVSALKPGYSFTQSPSDARELFLQPDALAEPLVLRLYPEALIVGTVTDEDALPIRNVRVTALRSANEEDGRHWLIAGVAHTNARGQFRLGVPSGDYRVESEYLALTPRRALLPASLPASASEAPLHLRSREQASVDLHPASAALVDVLARVDGESVLELSQMEAASSGGQRFPVAFTPSGTGGIQMSLPVGTYTLEARHRGFGGDASDSGTVSVTPTQAPPLTVALHFAPVAPIPIDIRSDDASSEALIQSFGRGQTTPGVAALGLTLEPLSGGAPGTEPLHPIQRFAEASFVAPAGAYRLRCRTNRGWYITSATLGGDDVLSHAILVAAGAASVPIKIVVSNQTASLKGIVRVGDKPAQGWVYLLATFPTATPLITLHSAADGTYSTTFLPPGSYKAIAFSHRTSFDPYDPAALASYASHLTTVTVQTGEKASIDLEMLTDAEMKS